VQRAVRHCRVLIADDNARARLGLRVLLALSPKVEVVGEAADGLEVLDLARDCRPDVVLMDVRMSRLDGLEAARQLKTDWPEIRIILTSMAAIHRARALATGADAFLLKGCPTEELLAAIRDR
jgi:DNA-binding NarL/FixJ family response regulator